MLKKIYFLLITAVALLSNGSFAQVNVTATAGTLGPVTYTNLRTAFDAINAGTHQGNITIDITANTSEGSTPATLNSSGAGSASYTGVLVRPTADGLFVTGNPTAGLGVIQLNGADNVTIDGDNPNTPAINRNLTVMLNNAPSALANSVIRLATSAAVTSTDNNLIKNCILKGNVTGGNSPSITSAASSTNVSFGIYCGGNGGVTATTAPSPITSETGDPAIAGTTIGNLILQNNAITQCGRGIEFNGAAASVGFGTTNILNNLIGEQATSNVGITPPYVNPSSTVYAKGIWVAGTGSNVINNNVIKNIISYLSVPVVAIEIANNNLASSLNDNIIETITNNGATDIAKGILVTSSTTSYILNQNLITNIQSLAGAIGTAGIDANTTISSQAFIQNSKITAVYNRGTSSTVAAYGINLTNGTGVQVINNFVSDIKIDMTAGNIFSAATGVQGIRIAGGINHRILQNSVNVFGPLFGTASANLLTTAFTITSAAITGMDVRNNIFSNTITSGTSGLAHVSMYLPSGATSAMNLTLNNNAYYSGAAASQGIAQAGTTYSSPVTTAGVGLYTAPNFNPAATTPVTNLRNYTSTLSAAGTNDNASFARTTAAPFLTPTDLHIDTGLPTSLDLQNKGASVGVSADIDNQLRNLSTPDIGADEFTIGVVAVGVEYLRGSKMGTSNYLDWKVNCSSDPSVRLILERSADGRTFTSIQDQTATASRCAQGFSYADAAPLAGINYYRLKTISPDGAFRYSAIVALINKDKGFELISVAPNPVRTSTVLSISSVKAGKMNIAVSDMNGRVIMTQNIHVIAGNNPITMNFATLGAGTYNIKVINTDNEVKVTRFMKY